MRERELYINGRDAWSTLRVFLTNDSYTALRLPANNKEYIENANRSDHGKRVLVEDIRKNDKDIVITFCIWAESHREYEEKYNALVDILDSGWIRLGVKSHGMVYKLIPIGYQDLDYYEKIGKLSVRFNEPDPSNRDRMIAVLGTIGSKILLTLNGQAIKI